jgi:transcriptional regulator with XRE-family HTH domain
MTGRELKAIRHQLGLTTRELGAALGYRGNANTLSVAIRLYESGKRPIPPWIARLVAMFGRHGVPPDWTIVHDGAFENVSD